MTRQPPTQRGARFEQLALDYLCEQGLRLQARNFRCRQGELDLVMTDGDTLVFIEVRYRADQRFGGPAASITAAKRRRIIHAARYYLARFGSLPRCRFDVIAITGRQFPWNLEWIRQAFDADFV